MDFAKLRAAALRDGEDEEAVTVDTRALIDKVLARYSGEWTTLRELIQNAADAQAATVTIRWETLPSTQVPLPSTADRSDLLKHAIAHHTLRRLVVENDGTPFTQTDWARLKRIAEGNPDETKIGAFGVGFYSVFADCEEPFVSSGSEAMAFYWKANALFTKKVHLPADHASPNTTFVLDYRSTSTPLPNLLSVSQFLATSLTFVGLQNIHFYVDDYQILSLTKTSSPNASLVLPRDLDARTKEGIMKVTSVERASVQIDALHMHAIGWRPQPNSSSTKPNDTIGSSEAPSLRSFFARLTSSASQSGPRSKAQKEDASVQAAISQDVTTKSAAGISLKVTTASLQANISPTYAAELQRATKKPPPRTTKLSILSSSCDEDRVSSGKAESALSKATDVFASVLPTQKPGGRVFIGFPTMQTTGSGLHISAPSVIPTVEREAIDLNARWVRTWNMEILRAAGIVARLAFSNEMEELSKELKLAPKSMTKETIAKNMPMALHTLKTFTFNDSTPSAQVGQVIEEAFWTCFKKATIEMYSSRGVLQTSQIRLWTEDLAKFVDCIPVVLPEMKDLPFVRKLIDFGLVSHITVTDIKKELEAKALTKTQLINFISWAGAKTVNGELDAGSRAALLEVAVGLVSDKSDEGEIIALGSIKTFLSANKIPATLPIPPTTIPFAFTAGCPVSQLRALGWEPLEIVPWLRFLFSTESSRLETESIARSPQFAMQALHVLSKNWDPLSPSDKATVTSLLQANTVMPTKLGMRKPAESFFPNVKLFDDLPVIQGCEKLKDKFLVAVGVRKTLDLDTIFARLLNASSETGKKKWSHMELIKYLASVQDDIPSDDMKKLRASRICPIEAGPKGMEPTKASEEMYKVSELFEPKDSLRALRLPILQWPGPPGSFRPSSIEAQFLGNLGLRRYPSAPELVGMMASRDETLRVSAMTYFIANHHSNGYGSFNVRESRKEIMPLQGSDELVMPAACFTNERAAVLGFSILRRDLHEHANKFGVSRDPPVVECVNRLLARPPQDHNTASTLFRYFASRVTELGGNNLARLQSASFVPVERPHTAKDSGEKCTIRISHISPSRAYLGSSSTYGDVFDFVDFGQEANAFLFHCGAKSEPTKLEIAHTASSEPARLLSILRSPEKYMELLKSLADAKSTLHRDKDLWRKMKSAPFLLAYKELATPLKDKLADVEEDDAPVKHYQLASANRIVILDDIISYRLFKEHLICAPEEDSLETFYMQLGAQKLSSIVEEDVRIGPGAQKPKMVSSLRKHVLERSKIFLYEYANYRRDAIRHDTKWLDKNLRVEMVQSVALRRTLKGQSKSHTEKRSAASIQTSAGCVLYVADSGQPDMYQIGQAICQMLLSRPNQQAYLFFEPFLTLDLFGLRARGYNVDRILRAKAAEARIAEEDRRKALEEEQKQIQERDKHWSAQGQVPDARAAEAAREVAQSPEQTRPVMPGSWGSTEEPGKHGQESAGRKGRSLFSTLSRHLGLEGHGHGSSEGQKQLLEKFMDAPTNVQEPEEDQASQQDNGRVTNPAVVRQNLFNAIKAARSHGPDSVFHEPSVKEVKEQATYCDKTPEANITFAAETGNGTKVYITKGMKLSPEDFLSANTAALNAFASLLAEIGSVYSLAPGVLHIFHDEAGGTIAFNTGGSIFCNLRFFLQLHAAQLQAEPHAQAKVDAAIWWWVVVAHELAHNLVSAHNSDHSYYTESFIQQYMTKMMSQTAQWMEVAATPTGRPNTQHTTRPPSIAPPPPYTFQTGRN